MAKAMPGGVPPEGGAAAGADAGAKPPPFGTAKPDDGLGDLPRVVSELTRAPRGCTRFKMRCNNYTPQKIRYILARTREDAEACYLKANGLAEQVAKLKKQAGANADGVEVPDLVVTELAD